ncbi:serine/threonine protein kinase [Paenibacillus sp. MMS18-CY102]|uniref:serine/threonine protein kinase n=1 Tax=Paenibacillus sp. MMS18-CY102 TaxID=2682849 RepID=UPI001365AD20|nr:serine/threonine-protein kinase [Paenibacillus sp. MMS18-CY102]MWC29573.1 protein kinase [Paenibacillus sp. MMS18-CY102]
MEMKDSLNLNLNSHSHSNKDALARNTILQGKYKIRKVLHQSELSIVYAAIDVDSSEMRAIKEFYPKAIACRKPDHVSIGCLKTDLSPTYYKLLEQFEREAMLLKELDHPNIVRYGDHFEANGTMYLVTSFHYGMTLSHKIQQMKAAQDEREMSFTTKEMVQIFNPLLDALSHMHAKQVVHRDIKPANIWLDQEGQPILLDLGSAIRYNEPGPHPIVTTPGYSPLELYSERSKQGPEADIYSLAATLFYVMSGGHAPYDVTNRLFDDKRQSVRAHSRRVGILLDRVIRWGLAVESHKRFRSLRWFRAALRVEQAVNLLSPRRG